LWLALLLTLPLLIVGCGGTDPMPGGGEVDMLGSSADMVGGANSDASNLALFAPCTSNDQCTSGLCTKISYDRSPTAICTYMCDASNMNPMCPMGCNPKGYCKQPK
jgi:hypothetical protein